jgi:D-arabinose 1-dehydrogenase-like Zn-dependent alcohol dehydrogenase
MVQATRERLGQIYDWVVKGRLRPQLARRFQLEAANDAYGAVEAPHGRGKIVLEIS